MRKTLLLIVCLLTALGASAQTWTAPAAPEKADLKTGENLYLYNVGSKAFFLGANDWGTRASVSSTHGYVVIVQPVEDRADTYYLTDLVENKNNQQMYTYAYVNDGFESIWVDYDKPVDESGERSMVWTLTKQADGGYEIENADGREDSMSDLYGKLGVVPSKGDTKLYLCSDVLFPDDAGKFMTSWYFVAPATYADYIGKLMQYNAAVALAAVIEEATTVNGTDEQAYEHAVKVYENTASTEEELNRVRVELEQAIYEARVRNTTVTNSLEMLQYQNIEQTFTDGTATGWTSTTGAQNKQASNGNNAKDFSVTGNHYENWSGSNFTPGKVYATAKNLPAGVYVLNALAYTVAVGDLYLYAGSRSTAVTATQIDVDQPTEVLSYLPEDGDMEIGLRLEDKTTNWIGMDNVNLYFMGANDESFTWLARNILDTDADYTALKGTDGYDHYQFSAYEAYEAVRAELKNATTADAVKAVLDTYSAAYDAIDKSMKAYAAYFALYEEAENWMGGTTSESDAVLELSDYLFIEEGEGFNGNGTAPYILEAGTLDTEQIKAETAYLNKMLADAMASSMGDGDDCTGLIVNPHFTSGDGWTKVGFADFPVGPENYRVASSYTVLFDVYQEITGLQNGLYELNLYDLFRPADYGSADYDKTPRAYVYMNKFQKNLNTIESGAGAELKYPGETSIPDVGFVPNDEESAAQAFQDGRYAQTLYALVTDGTLKLGVRNDLRYEGCWAVWSDMRLTFRAKNATALAGALELMLPEAKALLANKCGVAEIEALSDAITLAENETDGHALYDAFVEMKRAMEAVEASTQAYADLRLALDQLKEAIDAKPDYADIAKANALYSEALDGYEAGSYNAQAAADKTVEVSSMVVAIKFGGGGGEQDVTDLIVNPTFDPERGSKDSGTIEGWITSAMNGYKQYTVSYNRAGIELHQTINGLKKGKYKVTVHTYYRAGYYDEEYALYQSAGAEATHLTTLYARTASQTYATKVMNLFEGASPTKVADENCYQYAGGDINGWYAPDGTTPTAAWFADGRYLNELEFVIDEEGGSVTIGLEKTEILPNDYEVVGAWNLYYYGADDEPVRTDVTDLIVNPTFDPERGSKDSGTIEGWTTSAMNGYKQYTVSYNRAGIELHQTINGLPKGDYEVTVHTYYRAGYYDEEYALFQSAGAEATHLTTLYARTASQTYATKVMNLFEGASPTKVADENCYQYADGDINGWYAPDGTTPTAAWFADGRYLNTLPFRIDEEGGSVTIGLEKTEILPNDYEVVGAWHLYYLGDATGIDFRSCFRQVEAGEASIYNLQGQRLTAPQHGINIIGGKKVVIK
ncbi:MAG: hypothetical protein IKP91_03925 [Bacteroidaceae bacterium]|nr:hypothetical protein [Bacteroidaceae bacterium]